VSTAKRDPALDALLDFLHGSRGFDFAGYKQANLERRFGRRMEALGCDGYGNYLDYLEVHPEEYERLFDTLLINVTEFFRDPPAWEHLRADVLPGLLATKGDRDPVRIWSAGCATGEEAYTLAMVLAEALGEEAFRERAKIYATDVDELALAEARHAIYTHERAEKVPAELRERYFEPIDGRMAFRKDLRRSVIFGRNNLVSDAPISRLDLVVCRNTLMYFNAEAQERILRRFHFALRENGALMLGKSEMMISHRRLFDPIDVRKRIFRRRDQPASLPARLNDLVGGDRAGTPMREDAPLGAGAAFEVSLSPQVIVSRTGVLTLANLAARSLFGLGRDQIGRPLTELELSHRPTELRATIEQVLQDRRRAVLGEVRFKPRRGDERRLDVTVVPLTTHDGAVPGVSVVFEDVSRYAAMQRELEGNRRDLELAYEELQSTIDELETTNEELQSANEELQTTNEELQSTNEELETMNEELQSTNEELETINDELRDRTSELNDVNELLETILTSLGLGVAVVDRQQRVLVWNDRAEDMWGLRTEEAVEHHLLSLDIGLPVEQLTAPLRAVIGGGSGREHADVEAVNRRGRAITCSTTILPLSAPSGDGDVRGAILLMEDGRPAD
jgi:two-component system, chemotaxis family, CheB/CheR fusion protein